MRLKAFNRLKVKSNKVEFPYAAILLKSVMNKYLRKHTPFSINFLQNFRSTVFLMLFLPWTIYAQVHISYDDIISYSKSDFLTENKDSLIIPDAEKNIFIKINKDKPFPNIQVIYKTKVILEAPGFIKELGNDPFNLYLKIIRPSCCCLSSKEILVFRYNKHTSEKFIERYEIDSGVLLPIQDLVFRYVRVNLKPDSIVLFKYPSRNISIKINECTGKKTLGNKIGNFIPSEVYVIFEDDHWRLLLIQYHEHDKVYWTIGWSDVNL